MSMSLSGEDDAGLSGYFERLAESGADGSLVRELVLSSTRTLTLSTSMRRRPIWRPT